LRPSRFAGLQSQESQEIDPLSPIAYSRHTSQPATRVIKAWPMPTSARGLAANRANPRRSRAQNPKGKARLPGRAPRSPCRAGSPPLERGASRGRIRAPNEPITEPTHCANPLKTRARCPIHHFRIRLRTHSEGPPRPFVGSGAGARHPAGPVAWWDSKPAWWISAAAGLNDRGTCVWKGNLDTLRPVS